MAKTTLKVRAKTWDLFNRECKAASFRRDDFLNRVLPGEVALLKKITPCDADGERWLKRNWIDRGRAGDTELRPVPMSLADDVLEEMNNTCLEKKVPRDAFFDCALTYLTERMYEAVLVIKAPRTSHDLVSQIAFQLNDTREEVSVKDAETFLVETVKDWAAPRRLEIFSDGFYQDSLSFDSARVDEHKMWQELAATMMDENSKGGRKVRQRKIVVRAQS